MTPNPLDWPARPFLLFYLSVAVLAMGTVLALRRTLGSAGASSDRHRLGTIELAWLAGGWTRAADTIVLSLLTAGAASAVPGTQRLVLIAQRAPAGLETIQLIGGGEQSRSQVRAWLRGQLRHTWDELANRGLAPSPADLAWMGKATVAVLAVPVAFGIAKIAVGWVRGRPIDILVLLVVLTIAFGIWALRSEPHSTPRGRAALSNARTRLGRTVRAPMETELALAFAIAGPAALSGTAYHAFFKPASSYTSSTGCGSDGGGSGCGGCSGE